MRNRILLAATILAVFAGSFFARRQLAQCVPMRLAGGRPERIVSMAPSVTETLYALGLGDRVVGVTSFCRYPPQAQAKPTVGGYFNPNLEAVVSMRPDLVVLLEGEDRTLPALRKLGLPTLTVRHKDAEGILESITTIGRACGAEAEAQRLTADIRARIARIREKTAGLPRPKVLFVIQRTLGSGRLQDVCVAGSDGFFDTVVEWAGGEHAYPAGHVRFPTVSTEGILWMDPDVIVDLSSRLAVDLGGGANILDDWQQLPEVSAVRHGRLHALDQDYATVPGPRFILLVEDLARLIHPEIDW